MDVPESEMPPADLPVDLPAVVDAFNNCRRSDGTLATDHYLAVTNELARYVGFSFETNDISAHNLVSTEFSMSRYNSRGGGAGVEVELRKPKAIFTQNA